MGEQETLFQIPIDPEEFGALLPPSQLRKLDFSALDFALLQRAEVEYIKTYFPNEFNDFIASNGVIMILENVAAVGNILSLRSDILADASFLPTAPDRESVSQHLALIGERILPATPAVVDVEVTVPGPLSTELRIPAGTKFNLSGPDGAALIYELFRSPGDFTSFISIPPGKRGVVGHAIEGQFSDPITAVSDGGPDQFINIINNDILDQPIIVTVTAGDEIIEWSRVNFLERSEASDEVYRVVVLGNGRRIQFGNDINGKAPIAGQTITIQYRVGGGVRGRIGANFINETRPISPQPPASASVEVRFRNSTPSSGGNDEETIGEAKRRAPRVFSTQRNAVTGEDYGTLSDTFTHPVFGSVLKAVGVIRTGIDSDINQVVEDIQAATSVEAGVAILQTNFVNRNIVEVYVLASGPDGPVTPSAGLKRGLETFFSSINVFTDETRILDGAVKPIDVEATIILSRSADSGTTKDAVISAIESFFDISNFDLGEGLNVSNLYEAIQSVAGVKSANVFQPADNILPTKLVGSSTDSGVGFNELIVLGNLDLKFFFEQGNAVQNTFLS